MWQLVLTYLLTEFDVVSGHDGVCLLQQREPLRNDELRRQQRLERHTEDCFRLVPADGHVSTSGRRHRLLLRGGDSGAVGQHKTACSHDSIQVSCGLGH